MVLLKTLTGTVAAPVERVAAVIGPTVAQGDWWYRSEITLEPDGPGRTRVTQRIYNVADRARWAVWFVARKPLRAAPAAFRSRLAELERAA